MHKGVILLTQAENASQARAKAEQFMDSQVYKVCDWYMVGGRWTGTLDGYNPREDPTNYIPCDLCNGTGYRNDDLGQQSRRENPSYTCNACGHRDDAGKWTHGPMGPGMKLKWSTQWEHDGDIQPLSDLHAEEVVEDWAKDWKEGVLTRIAQYKARYANQSVLGTMVDWLDKLEKEVEEDHFSDESNVFDIDRNTNVPPQDTTGYWAIMIDFHF